MSRRSGTMCQGWTMQGIILYLFQGISQGIWITTDLAASLICIIFSRTRYSHLNQGRSNRGNNNGHNHAQEAAIIIIIRTAYTKDSRPLSNIGNGGNNTSHSSSHTGNKSIPMLYMRKLMSQHTADFLIIQGIHQTSGNSHSCMGWITPCCKSIRGTTVNNIYLWHRQLCISCQSFYQAIQLRCTISIYLSGIIHLQHNAVTEPVGYKIEAQGYNQHQHSSPAASESSAYGYHNTHKQSHENSSL